MNDQEKEKHLRSNGWINVSGLYYQTHANPEVGFDLETAHFIQYRKDAREAEKKRWINVAKSMSNEELYDMVIHYSSADVEEMNAYRNEFERRLIEIRFLPQPIEED